jgi:hypothetical protein
VLGFIVVPIAQSHHGGKAEPLSHVADVLNSTGPAG